jgi:hypothetical protein
MSNPLLRAMQGAAPDPNLRLVRVTIVTISPLTVELPGGATLPGVAVAGLTYTANTAAFALVQEPLVGAVFPTT